MPTGCFLTADGCSCNQHGPGVGAVTFSGPVSGWVPPDPYPGMAEHVRRAVDDYVATLGEVDDDAATVVELLQRGDSWHISIRRGAMHYENAEPSLPAALEAVGRVLGQSVGSCAEVPTSEMESEIRAQVEQEWKNRVAKAFDIGARSRLADLPPCQITDPEALAKLTPALVRAYLKGKGWMWTDHPTRFVVQEPGGATLNSDSARGVLVWVALAEHRSQAAVYLDILQTEPGDS